MTELKVNDLKDVLSQSIRWQQLIRKLAPLDGETRPFFKRIYWYYINCYPHWIQLSDKTFEWLHRHE